MKTAQQKLRIVQLVFVLTFAVFIGTFIHTYTLDDQFLIYYLMIAYPITMSLGTIFLCRIKAGGFFLLYILTFAFLHYFMYTRILEGMEILWILGWVIVPAFCTWGIVMTTWRIDVRKIKIRETNK